MPLWIKRHPMISNTAAHRVLADHRVRGRIDHGQDILALQIDVHLARDRIVLRHTRLAVKVQRLDDAILSHVHHHLRLAPLGGHVRLMKRTRVGDSVRLVGRG